jgi:hypothetical protein
VCAQHVRAPLEAVLDGERERHAPVAVAQRERGARGDAAAGARGDAAARCSAR